MELEHSYVHLPLSSVFTPIELFFRLEEFFIFFILFCLTKIKFNFVGGGGEVVVTINKILN